MRRPETDLRRQAICWECQAKLTVSTLRIDVVQDVLLEHWLRRHRELLIEMILPEPSEDEVAV